MRAELVEAEQSARYAWIAPLATGRRVLDAGCGLGRGAAILLEAGAREVLGVDSAEAVLDAGRPAMPPGVRLETGDLRALDTASQSFDLVVCMDTIGSLAEPAAIFDELARVLAADGVLVVSVTNGASGDEHDAGESRLTSAELERVLRDRFARVELVAQRTFTGSVIAAVGDADGALRVNHRQLPAGSESARHTLALAGDGELPNLSGMVVVGPEMQWVQLAKSWAAQQRLLDAELQRARDAERRLEGHEELARRLVEAEQLLAETPERKRELAEAIAQRDHAVAWARARVADLEAAQNASSPARQIVREMRRLLRRD
jgi:protein-L-isoaspartate O-methyltransferase